MKILFRNWFNTLEKELLKSSSFKIITPFVSEYFFQKIKNNFSLSKIELITRFNLTDFANGVSSLDALKLLVDNYANVYGIKDLHSKVYIFDDDRFIISSANLTRNGLHNNYECGVLITDKNKIRNVNKQFYELKQISYENEFDLAKYKKWKKEIKNCQPHNSPKRKLKDYGSSESENVDPKIKYYIKFFGTTKSRESLSFKVRSEVERALCNYACGFSLNKKPRQINDNDIIYFARLTKDPDDYAIFGKALAIKYKEERDQVTENEIKQRKWKKKWPIYLRVKKTRFIDGTLGDCTLLNQLISELDYLAFESTKIRFERGERNINPKKSLSQQPYIRLSIEGANWVEKRFQYDLDDFGIIDNDFLEALPKPDIEVE